MERILRQIDFVVMVKRVFVYALLASLVFLTQGFGQPVDSRGNDIHFRGPISAIDKTPQGTVVGLTIQVNRSQIGVRMTSWTLITQGRGFRYPAQELKLGDFLEVSGFFSGSGAIFARQIHVESSDAVGVEGTIEQLSGMDLRVNGIQFQLNQSTRIRAAGSDQPQSPAALKVGQTIRLRAAIQNQVFVVKDLEFGKRTVESEPLQFEGFVRRIESQFLYVDVGVSGVDALVAIDETTKMNGFVAPGSWVEVEGRFLPGSALVHATRIAVDENENGNPYDEDDEEIPGSVQVDLEGKITKILSQASGSMMRFLLGESTIVDVGDQTSITFSGERSASAQDLVVGAEVKVEGTRGPNQEVHADSIQIKEDEPEDPDDPDEDKVPIVQGSIDSLDRKAGGMVTSMVVAGQSVNLQSDTSVTGTISGTLTMAALEVGQTVKVFGERKGDGSIQAKTIEIQE